ncbi:hypothetical protein AMAG_19098 [Allomyces macrogynus ATCC 38327]|uniref:Uncharacterized protein n=1 Tax=Allomyces macrogynus (strain ATCC 38327) TaxID=578462 RepID=A0A0L0SNB6_ALLM3|nr:hypothetical protein AMAG_19098 [Allomyces macrogynus ATCC 38327]|eukprot:KNE64011.1 hypothetical protein AMAG_19098 [Allomyces macrogynus ATCC 38327]
MAAGCRRRCWCHAPGPYPVVSPGQASLGILPPGCAWFPAPPAPQVAQTAAQPAAAGGAALDLPTFPAELFTNDVANMLRQQSQTAQQQPPTQQGDAEKAWEAQFAGLAAAAWPSATGGQ